MKKLLALLGLSLSIISCGSKSTSVDQTSKYKEVKVYRNVDYWLDTTTMKYNVSWKEYTYDDETGVVFTGVEKKWSVYVVDTLYHYGGEHYFYECDSKYYYIDIGLYDMGY